MMPSTRLQRLTSIVLLGLLFTIGCGETETEGEDGASTPQSATGSTGAASEPSTGGERVILFLGNSLSAGLGIDPDLSFPALIQNKIDSLGLDFSVVNAGLSGETTAGGLRRAEWLFAQPVDLLVLELGGNDGLRGISPESSEANLQSIIDLARERHPDIEIVLAGMQVPPNLGGIYTNRFERVYTNLAEDNDVHLIPFLLEGVGGIPELNQRDGIHPTEAGHRILAENVWKVLEPVLLGMSDPSV